MTPPREGGARAEGRTTHAASCNSPSCPCYLEGLSDATVTKYEIEIVDGGDGQPIIKVQPR